MMVVRSRIRTRLDGEHRVRSETCPNEERRIVESLDSTVCHDSNLPFGANPRLSYSGHRRWIRHSKIGSNGSLAITAAATSHPAPFPNSLCHTSQHRNWQAVEPGTIPVS
jgi:hypothetical protein